MQKTSQSFPLERFDAIRSRPGDFRLLERIPITRPEVVSGPLPIPLTDADPGETLASVVFLDTETTGIDVGREQIIELGMVRADYSPSRQCLVRVATLYDQFEDPGRPLGQEITALTGITDAMLRGKALSEERVSRILVGNPLVIAHNAAFDRPFFEKRFGGLFRDLPWACSMRGINWERYGDHGVKLELLNMVRGWFYEAHRAVTDCLAQVWLLHTEPRAFAELLSGAGSSTKIIRVTNSFAVKDELKGRGFRFSRHGNLPGWWLRCRTADEYQRADAFLQALRRDGQRFDVTVEEETAQNRYRM